MALLVCRGCGTRFSVGAPWCPQCTSTDAHIEGEESMPHSNRGGVSDKTVPRPEPHTPEAEADPAGIGDVEATGTHEPAPVRPTLTARKDEWADYVEALGLDAEPDATKTRLIELADEAEARAGGTE